MKTHTVEGIGVAIYGEEENYLYLEEKDSVAVSDLFEKAGAETVYSHLEHAFDCQDVSWKDEEFGGRSITKTVAEYRAQSGRHYPPVYRVKLTIELEEIPEEESNAFWERRRSR